MNQPAENDRPAYIPLADHNSDYLQSLPIWQTKEALERLGNNQNLFERITQMFLSSLPNKWLAMQQAIESGDLTEVQKLSHSLKGVSAQVGALRFGALMAVVEAGAKGQELIAVQGLQLQHHYQELIDVLSAHCLSVR